MKRTASAGERTRPGVALASGASAIAACLLLAGGCALSSHESGSKDMLFDRDGVDIVTTSSSRQMVMIKDRDSVERFCRGPEPDSSLATSSGVTLSLPVGTRASSIGGQKQQESAALGGRNPAVLITRELLYRACELSMNTNADPEKTLAIYREFLQVAAQIAATQGQAGTDPAPPKASGSTDDKSGDSDDSKDDKGADKPADRKKK